MADAQDLPVHRPPDPPISLTPGVTYRWTTGTGRWLRFDAPAGETLAFDNTAPEGAYLTVFASNGETVRVVPEGLLEWLPGALEGPLQTISSLDDLNEYLVSLERQEMPADLIGALRDIPQLVVGEPLVRRLGDVDATFVDVTVDDDFTGGATCGAARCIYLFGFDDPVKVESTMRIGVLPPSPDGDQWYVILTDAETSGAFIDSFAIYDT